jgi:hypothetical protein
MRASEMGAGSRGRGQGARATSGRQGARATSGRRRRARADGDGMRASEMGEWVAALPAGVCRAEAGGSGFFQPKRAELGSKTLWAGARACARK